jgi:hypothetical protein
MRMSFPKAFLSGCMFLLVLATTMNTVLAHHSFSAFNMNEEKTVTGIVKEVEWTNPHIWIWIDVKDEKGVASTYGFEGMSPNFLERRNWTRTTLKVGDKVTVAYRPLRDGKNGGMWMNGKMESGKVLTMGGGGQ